MFPFCKDSGRLTADFSGARIVTALVNKEKTALDLTLSLTQPAPPLDISAIEEMISHEYDLSVKATAVYARAKSQQKGKNPKSGASVKPGSVIMGRRAVGTITPMAEVKLELGKVTVKGVVCDVSSRYVEKSDAWVLSFDLTDFNGTIHISKFLTDDSAAKTVQSIWPGMWLTVSGKLSISRYDGDLALEPSNIVTAEHVQRLDAADEKRVELHLHTKMSALDAVTDIKDCIMRASEWGHPAIAVTDHGVVHSFPDAADAAFAAGNNIKIIYGIEGYYLNDIDYCTAVLGNSGSDDINSSLDDNEFVVFDIETTGLTQTEDAILEIGAILVKGGQELARFHTFADPGARIPFNITNLTGIKDEDVAGAPSQKDAVLSFLKFAGGRTLVAHSANFDVGFINEACHKHAIPFDPCYVDTLALARCLLPKLKNHRLETVVSHFACESFGHHRAVEDAAVTALIFHNMMNSLKQAGITRLNQINSHLSKLSDAIIRKGRIRYRHIVLLAKNQTGLTNLYKLVTKSHLEDFDRYPIIRRSVLAAHREGLIVGSACEAGEVFEAVTEKRGALDLRRLADFYDYLEIQPISNNMFMLFGDKPRAKNEDELRAFNRRLVELGKELGKPVVATGDVHFLDPEHEVFRRILLTSKGFSNADDNLPVYLRTTDEMLEEFSYLGKETAYDVVVKNSQQIADMCEAVNPLPPKKALFAPKLERSAEELKELVHTRLNELYGDSPPEILKKRVSTELGDILDRNYDVIYMTAQKLVADANKHGYLVGSRGSVGSSVVAFLAGITEVNALPAHYRCPNCRVSDFESGAGCGCGADMQDANCPVCGKEFLKDGFNIPFETFLGFDGDKVPDIDLNFSGEYQTQAHRYTTELFGADYVFRAGTINTIAEKTAYGYVKNYLEKIGKTVTKAEENRLARGCVGVKRTTGQHPGGLIIVPQGMEITDFCPAQRPADATDTDVVTTHFDYHCMEDNLIKLDELGHDDPTMIKMLEEMTGVTVNDIRLDDPQTMALFTSPSPLGLPENDDIIGATGSIGIPEFGTNLTRQMLCDTKPETFDTLVRLSGFSHGTDVWLGNAKDLILSGKATVGETVGCRDDIMLFLISKGMDDRYAFKISESVRKGNGLPDGAADEMARYNVPGWYIESCKKIKYLFSKAHAVAYVMMAFRIAWFKVHRPLEFYSAYFYRRSRKDSFDADSMTRGINTVRSKIKEISNNPGAKTKDEDLLTTLEACYEFYMRGFEFTDIDLYESDPLKFLVVGDKKLRPPFVAISGLGETAARDLAENRNGREFISIDDLSAVCPKVSKTHLEQLRSLGALRNLPETSQLSLF
jgi:DNA polymerase-3 subunit alpha (Gram-positive type)